MYRVDIKYNTFRYTNTLINIVIVLLLFKNHSRKQLKINKSE